MGPINWDRFKEPDDPPEIKVTECAACGKDLYAGEEVVEDLESGEFFCDYGCAYSFIEDNPDIYPDGEDSAALVLAVLEEPEPDFDDWRRSSYGKGSWI